MCANCKVELVADSEVKEGGAKARSKSPLVNSAERGSKCQRVDISTPLGACLQFPKIISDTIDPGEKGKGDLKGKGGKMGK